MYVFIISNTPCCENGSIKEEDPSINLRLKLWHVGGEQKAVVNFKVKTESHSEIL